MSWRQVWARLEFLLPADARPRPRDVGIISMQPAGSSDAMSSLVGRSCKFTPSGKPIGAGLSASTLQAVESSAADVCADGGGWQEKLDVSSLVASGKPLVYVSVGANKGYSIAAVLQLYGNASFTNKDWLHEMYRFLAHRRELATSRDLP